MGPARLTKASMRCSPAPVMPPPGDSRGSSRQPPLTRVECSLLKWPSTCSTSPIAPLGDDALELAHGSKAALVVAEAKHDLGLGHRGDGAFGFGARQRQRLLAPHRLACCRNRADLLDMQRMRRRQEHRLHARIGDGIGKFGAQFKAVGLGEIGDELGLFAHAANEPQAFALALHRFDDGFAPASQPDDGCVDHRASAVGGLRKGAHRTF